MTDYTVSTPKGGLQRDTLAVVEEVEILCLRQSVLSYDPYCNPILSSRLQNDQQSLPAKRTRDLNLLRVGLHKSAHIQESTRPRIDVNRLSGIYEGPTQRLGIDTAVAICQIHHLRLVHAKLVSPVWIGYAQISTGSNILPTYNIVQLNVNDRYESPNLMSRAPSPIPDNLTMAFQCCPGKVAPTDGKSLPLNVLWPVLPGNDLKSRGRKWPPERSIPTRHNGG